MKLIFLIIGLIFCHWILKVTLVFNILKTFNNYLKNGILVMEMTEGQLEFSINLFKYMQYLVYSICAVINGLQIYS